MENIDKIKCVLIDFEQNDKTLDEAANEILRLFSVVGRSEQLKCRCKKAQFTRTVDTDFNALCGKCGKAL
jgi:hypothetical protein